MGHRFILARHLREGYSQQRVRHRLNESDFEPHRLRPYGLESKGFAYRQMFERHQSRQGNVQEKRRVKKSARQQARRQLLSDESENALW